MAERLHVVATARSVANSGFKKAVNRRAKLSGGTGPPEIGFRYAIPAPWRSGYAAACKAVYTGSIPVGASGSAERIRLGYKRRAAPCATAGEGRRRF
jgi:hypothetical protein